MRIINALPQLKLYGFDEHTAVAALSSALGIGSHSVIGKSISYGDEKNGFQVIMNRDYRVSKIEVKEDLWSKSKSIIEADRNTANQIKIVHTILFSVLPLKGFYRVNDWLQLSLVRVELLGSRPFHAAGSEIDLADKLNRQIPRPFILEVKYRSSSLIWVESIESYRALDNARRLLSAWISLPLIKGVEAYNWVMINGVGPQIALGSMPSGIDEHFQNATEFSDVAGYTSISPAPLATYIDEVVNGSDEIRLTDMSALKKAFDKLLPEDQLQYLRCCSAIHEAEYHSRHTSQAIVSYVSAVEALLGDVDQCMLCKSHVGINAAFKHFVNHYIKPSDKTRLLLEGLYAWRSRLTHGAYALPIDEPFMGHKSSDGMLPLMAHWIAKKGAINWLIERAKKKMAPKSRF